MRRQSNRARRGSHKPGRLLVGLLVSVSPWALNLEANAQTQAIAEDGQVRVAYDIPAQDLTSALTQYARQSDLRVLYPANRLAGRAAPQVRGSYTRDEALQRLMSRSGLSATIAGETIQIQEQRRPQQDGASAEPERVRAENETVATEQSDAAPADEEIVVTGTRIRGVGPIGANVVVLDRDAIDETGRSTLQDVIQTLPQNFGGSQNEATQEGTLNARSNFTFGSTIDLRGLGSDATLTLVNGRRMAPGGTGNFIDISTIPLSAVERIEVLADGASATYGADAVGGVVNIILNNEFDGAESAIRYGGATQGGAEDFGASHLMGWNWRGGHLTAGYDYRRRGDIDILERDFTETADFRAWGGSNFERVNSNPGNITRIGATMVSLAIPRGQDGTSLSEADLISGAPNFGNINRDAWLMPRQESHALFLSARQDIGANFEIFADLIAGNRQAYSERENLGANLIVPQTNAYRVLNNLFPGQGNLTVAYHMGADLGPVLNTTETETFSSIVGGAYSFANDWRIEASVARAESEETIDLENFFDSATIAGPLASGNLATAFNPFADGSNTNAAVLASISFDQHADSRGVTTNYSLKADGPLWPLWGGVMRAAFGIERREETFRHRRYEIHNSGISFNPTAAPGSRTVDAIFAELSLPLIDDSNDVFLVRNLDVSIFARREEASDYGGETTPRAGINWEITDGLAVRGSWGQSFKGPLFQQMLGGIGLSYVTATAAQDPLADNGSTGVLAVAGSNPALRPERAQSWTAGIEMAPPWIRGLRTSATYFDIEFEDRVASPGSPFVILANPAGFESIVFRDPSPELIASYLALGTPTGTLPSDGIEVIIDRRSVNLSNQRVRGIDISGVYAMDLPIGELTFSGAVSILLQHELTIAPGATPVDSLNTLNGPVDLRGRASVNWRSGIWNAGLSVNYLDNYTDNASIPSRPIDEFVTYDARIALDWRHDEERGPQLALSIQNLLDEDPPFVNNSTGYAYDASNAAPFGRVITLELRQRW